MKKKFNFGDILVEISNGCKSQFDSEYLGKRTIGFYFEYGDFPEVMTGDDGYRYYAIFNLLWFKFFVSWVNGSFDIEADAVTSADKTDTANTYSIDDTRKTYGTPVVPLFPVSG